MSEPNDDPLSPAGRERREAILALARGAARARRLRRRAARATTAVGGVILVGLGLYAMRAAPHEQPRPLAATPVTISTTSTSAPPPRALFASIETDPTIVRRLTVAPQPRRWATISDDELLASLAQAGQPAGLIELEGRTILVSSAASPRE